MNGNPFDDPLALKNSRLHFVKNGAMAPVDGFAENENLFLSEAYFAFCDFVQRPEFSCVGAKAALNREGLGFAIYPELGSAESVAGLARDLCHFARSTIATANEYATFVAVFRGPRGIDEATFERFLWQQLEQLHALDSVYFDWDPLVRPDLSDPQFSFSFAGCAFYVIGLHGESSREARRFPWPTLVFNPHEQFQRLRRDGKWKRMQHTIREREVALQGSINPMVRDFGEESEARQYSGRAVAKDWTPPTAGKCPFAH